MKISWYVVHLIKYICVLFKFYLTSFIIPLILVFACMFRMPHAAQLFISSFSLLLYSLSVTKNNVITMP